MEKLFYKLKVLRSILTFCSTEVWVKFNELLLEILLPSGDTQISSSERQQ